MSARYDFSGIVYLFYSRRAGCTPSLIVTDRSRNFLCREFLIGLNLTRAGTGIPLPVAPLFEGYAMTRESSCLEAVFLLFLFLFAYPNASNRLNALWISCNWLCVFTHCCVSVFKTCWIKKKVNIQIFIIIVTYIILGSLR